MDGEMKIFLKVWISVYASLTYCYFISKKIPKGKIRLFSLLPIIFLFTVLPLNLSSVHLGGTTGFFIAWLANFKLLLFAFDQGPLSSDPSVSLLRFISIACLPIKIKQNPPRIIKNKDNPSPQNTDSSLKSSLNLEKPLNNKTKEDPSPQITTKGHKIPLNFATKCLLFALLIRIYDYKQHIHPTILLFLYCFHVYFCLEIILAMVAAMARSLLGLELEPQFDEPYLSTSLQDFWGRRWNLMVTSILRPTVYGPVRSISTRMLGKKWGPFPAVLATFLVSGLMHELIFYYLGRVWPTWEITWFFALHGICLVVEIEVKKALTGRWRLHRAVSGPLAVGFVAVTGFWLFFPQLLRCGADVRAIQEYAIMVEFVKGIVRTIGVSLAEIGVLSA